MRTLGVLGVCLLEVQAVFGQQRPAAVVPGAGVPATNLLTGETKSSKADLAGSYLFPSLPVGTYRVEVEATGFKNFIHEGIELNVNRKARVDAQLEAGQVTEQMQVTGDVPLVARV